MVCLIVNPDLNVDLPALKRRFEKLQEETLALEGEYEELQRKAGENLLKKIRSWEVKQAVYQVKIDKLKKRFQDVLS